MTTLRPALLLACLLVATPVIGGCQTPADNQGRSTQFQQPDDLVAGRLVMGNEPLEDRDRNGYVDTFRIVVYVFGDETVYPLPMLVDATFQFRLVGEDGESLGVWAFPSRESRRAVFPTQPGPAYGFEISLNDQGTDRVPAQSAGLTCQITTDDGDRVSTREPLMLRIGGKDPR